MPTAYPRRRSNLRALLVIALLVILGLVGFLVMRSGNRMPGGAEQSAAEPASASDRSEPSPAPSAPTNIASRATVAKQASSNASRPTPPWQASVQPAVVTAIRNDSLAAYQVQLERWSCEETQCVGNLRIPPTVEAGRKGDISAAANIMDRLKEQMAPADVEVGLQSIHPSPQGLAVSFEFTPNASTHGRFYTYAEIAAIRGESVEQGMKACKGQAH